MKQSFYLPVLWLLFLACSFSAAAQKVQIDNILRQPALDIESFDTSGFDTYQVAIRFPYGSPRVLNAWAYDSIKAYGKVSVEYIYTKYTQSQPGQKELDRARFEALRSLAPDLFDDTGIAWRILVQNAATTADSARQLFHGFVITYQPPVTEEVKVGIKTELDRLVDCAKKRPPETAPKYPGGVDSIQRWLGRNIRFPKFAVDKPGVVRAAVVNFNIDTASGKPHNVVVSKGVNPTHNEHIKTIVRQMSGWKPGDPRVLFSLIIQFSTDEVNGPQTKTSPLFGYIPEDCRGLKTDSLVVKVFERNKDWKKMLVVEDVTGSMMPYVADLLLWNALKGNLQNTEHFVFFNDGDSKDNYEKEIGKTGGIYQTKPKNVDVLEKTMIDAIAGGHGGDTPENDIEAILAGMAACPDCEEIILIADNTATPRDMALLEKVTKPVHVILCGVRYYPNPAHMTIAFKTKGSLHTIKEDIYDLAKMQEGQRITVMGTTYKVLNGKVVEVSRE